MWFSVSKLIKENYNRPGLQTFHSALLLIYFNLFYFTLFYSIKKFEIYMKNLELSEKNHEKPENMKT